MMSRPLQMLVAVASLTLFAYGLLATVARFTTGDILIVWLILAGAACLGWYFGAGKARNVMSRDWLDALDRITDPDDVLVVAGWTDGEPWGRYRARSGDWSKFVVADPVRPDGDVRLDGNEIV